MRILLDECIPHRVADAPVFSDHHVDHVTGIGLSQATNGHLREYAEKEYDLLISSDRHFQRRSELGPTPTMGIIYMRVTPNVLELIRDALAALLAEVDPADLVGKLTIVRRDGWDID